MDDGLVDGCMLGEEEGEAVITAGIVIVLPLVHVTAVCDKARPSNVEVEPSVMLVPAKIVPTKEEKDPVPNEVPIRQKILLASAPPDKVTDVDEAVEIVEGV